MVADAVALLPGVLPGTQTRPWTPIERQARRTPGRDCPRTNTPTPARSSCSGQLHQQVVGAAQLAGPDDLQVLTLGRPRLRWPPRSRSLYCSGLAGDHAGDARCGLVDVSRGERRRSRLWPSSADTKQWVLPTWAEFRIERNTTGSDTAGFALVVSRMATLPPRRDPTRWPSQSPVTLRARTAGHGAVLRKFDARVALMLRIPDRAWGAAQSRPPGLCTASSGSTRISGVSADLAGPAPGSYQQDDRFASEFGALPAAGGRTAPASPGPVGCLFVFSSQWHDIQPRPAPNPAPGRTAARLAAPNPSSGSPWRRAKHRGRPAVRR